MLTTFLALAAAVLPISGEPSPAVPIVPKHELAAQDDSRFTPSPTDPFGSRAHRRQRYPIRGKGFTRSGLPKDRSDATVALYHQSHGSRDAWTARRSVGTAIGNTRFSKGTGLYCPKETAMCLRRRYLWRNPDAEALLPGAHLGGGGETFEQEGGEPDMNDGDLFLHITDYAERVGITTGGARARCLRGAVEARKVDGQWWVNVGDAR